MEVVAAMDAAAVAAHTSAPRGKVLLRCALRLLRPTVGPSRGTTAWLAPGRSGAGRCSRGGTVLLTDLLTLDSLQISQSKSARMSNRKNCLSCCCCYLNRWLAGGRWSKSKQQQHQVGEGRQGAGGAAAAAACRTCCLKRRSSSFFSASSSAFFLRTVSRRIASACRAFVSYAATRTKE